MSGFSMGNVIKLTYLQDSLDFERQHLPKIQLLALNYLQATYIHPHL